MATATVNGGRADSKRRAEVSNEAFHEALPMAPSRRTRRMLGELRGLNSPIPVLFLAAFLAIVLIASAS